MPTIQIYLNNKLFRKVKEEAVKSYDNKPSRLVQEALERWFEDEQ